MSMSMVTHVSQPSQPHGHARTLLLTFAIQAHDGCGQGGDA